MMRALLVERFRLKAHFETGEKTIRRPVEILVVESVDRPTPD